MAKMNQDIVIARNLAKLQKLLGSKVPQVAITKEVTREARATKPTPIYEAEAVLKFLEKPARFMQKQCGRKECGEWFGTNYRAVGYCSDNCRIKELASIGILWDPSKKEEERWGGEPPLLIPPEALKMLIQMAEKQIQDPEVEQASEDYVQELLNVEPVQSDLVHTDHENPEVNDLDTTDLVLQPPLTCQFDFSKVGYAFGA